jgi:uncharacterized RDD family membrane protein YckC
MKYHITQNGRQLGELDEAQIQEMLGSGQLSPQDLGWRDGMGGWEPLSRIFPYHVGPAGMAVPGGYGTGGGQELADRGVRLLAVLADSGMALVAMLPAFTLVMQMIKVEAALKQSGDEGNAELTEMMESMNYTGPIIAGVLLLVLLIANLYFLATRGQTLGKMLCKIKIVDMAGQNPGFVKAFLLRSLVPGIIGAVPFLGPFFSLADPLFIFREDRRCLHDQIAGTKVVTAPKQG